MAIEDRGKPKRPVRAPKNGGGRSSLAGLSNYSGLPGQGQPPSGDRFVCPKGCGFEWVRFAVGDEIPKCPKHGIKLVRA